jgi:predicted dienelactone hydrolase
MLTLLLGCTAPDDTAAEFTLEDLAYRGSQNVGYRTEVMTYTDPLGTERELDLMHWYPTDQSSGAKAEYLGQKREDVYRDAPELPAKTVLFSHGHQGFPEASGFLMVHLASWGYHVVAMEHAGDTTFDGGDRDTEIYYQRPHDVSATMDALGIDETVAFGHSFGGYTLFANGGASYDPAVLDCPEDDPRSGLCDTMTDEKRALFEGGFKDDRIQAIVPMAAGDADLFGAGISDLSVPALMMTGDCDHPPGGFADDLWAGFQGEEDHGLVIANGGHQTFTNFSGTLDDCEVLIDAEEGWTLINGWGLAFVRQHLDGDTEMQPVLEGDVVWSDAASLR